MKRKLKILNAFMGLMVLFAVLFQSVHSIEHLVQQFSGKICVHKYTESTTLNHSHHWEKCSVCDFTFSNFTEIDIAFHSFENATFYYKILYFTASENIPFFSGSSFSLRGPPVV